MNKREFLKTSALLSVAGLMDFRKLDAILERAERASPEKLAADEEFWKRIRENYSVTEDFINLENGYYSIQPNDVLEAYMGHIRRVNKIGAYYMRTTQYENKAKIAAQLSQLAGCAEDELIITRNTTESLNMVISGFPWERGDEAVMAEQDYGSMLDMFEQVSRRYGIVNKKISIPLHPISDEEIVNLYEKAITSRTKLLMVCHMINITGQILPVRKICDMARAKGVQVMVDGAHAFAHIGFKISDLNCDYYGCSLHKWLSAPLGAGFLYVGKQNIRKIWPLFAERKELENRIERLNHTGTIPVHTDLAIADAIQFHLKIGSERKESRLRYLQNYWLSKVKDLPGVVVNTPAEAHRSCAIANIGIKNMKPKDFSKTLFDKYKILTVPIDWVGVSGCRVTPGIYTSTAELDVFVNAVKQLAA